MKNKKGQIVSVAILIIIIVVIGFYLRANSELLHSLSNMSLTLAFWLIVFRILFIATNGLFLQAFANKFGIQLNLMEWFGLAIVTTMGNYITPFSGGMVARATYLKYRYAFPYAQFATLLASNYLVTFWVIGVVGLVSLLIFVDTAQFYWQVILFFLTITITISILALLPTIKLPWNHRMARVLNTSLEGWALVKNDSLLLARLVAYTLANISLNGFSFWVAYRALGFPVSFAPALLIGLLAVFSILINVTPGNLGIQESVISLSSGLLGAGVGQGLLVGLLIRAATLVSAFTLGPIFSFLLSRELTAHQLASTPSAPDTEQPG